MKEDIVLLKKNFKKIRQLGLIKSLRDGPTGVGYTFESLLNKKEDQECKPDFGSIELKCKLGYSKSSLTLFNCVPTRNNEFALKYIFDTYSNYRYGNKGDCKLFERKVFSKYCIKRFNKEFKLKVDYYSAEIIMNVYENGKYIEKVCSWSFRKLERKLKKKLNTMAIIEAYPYRRNTETYYKYVKLEIYKLIGFFEFLQLIENDKIYIQFYLKDGISSNGNALIENHGVAFKLKQAYIDELFYKLRQ